jgi:hypothetical protein
MSIVSMLMTIIPVIVSPVVASSNIVTPYQ